MQDDVVILHRPTSSCIVLHLKPIRPTYRITIYCYTTYGMTA
jgi:hypothetical protein